MGEAERHIWKLHIRHARDVVNHYHLEKKSGKEDQANIVPVVSLSEEENGTGNGETDK